MEKWHLLFLAILNLKALAKAQSQDSWIGIDCGSNKSTLTNQIVWQTDDDFIKTGTNHVIPNDTVLAVLNTVRVFKEQNKNCYTMPTIAMNRYFIRAVFYYANYDGLSSPPTFGLEIDGNRMVTVDPSISEIQSYEILYLCKTSNISVCLARTHSNQFPFISSLEAWMIPSTMYTEMNTDLAWVNSYRYNYGADSWIIGYLGDDHNRIWEPFTIPNAVNTSADLGTTPIYDYSYEDPPKSAILDAIEAQNETTSLFLNFNPVQTITPLFVYAYFTEMDLLATGREFDIYIGGKSVVTVAPTYSICTAEPIFVQSVTPNLTIELRPDKTASLPPIISAIEIYTACDPLITTGTSQNDVNGLNGFLSTFDQLKGWSGEPCLPADTVWQWLGCTGTDPPRVTSLYLSGYGLNGTLPNFSQMQALEDIDLSNNSLSGQIPGFLGQLPNLKKLNLSHNDFSGKLPSSIRDKRGLIYDISGNPNADATGKDKSSKGITIGLAVGIPLLVIILILGIVYWLARKRAKPGPNPVLEPETGHEESLTISMNTVQMPPQPTSSMAEEDIDDCVPVDVYDTKPNGDQTMVPEMDLEELEGLIQKYHAGVRFDDDDSVEVGGYGANDDQSMVPDWDLEELDYVIQNERERADKLINRT